MYTFKLEALLEHRKFIEDTLQKELSEIKRQLLEEEENLAQLIGKEKNMAAKQKKIQEKPVSSQEMIMHHNYLVRLADELKRQKRRILSVEKSFQKKQEELIEAVKNRKALDKLKEKGLKAYTEKLLKKEEEFINEVAVTRYNHSR